MNSNRHDEADNLARNALALLEHGESSFDLFRAQLVSIRAFCAIHRGEVELAEELLQQEFDWLQGVLEELQAAIPDLETPAGIQMGLASWCTGMAELRGRRGDHAGAIPAWRQALSIRRAVAASDDFHNTVHDRAGIAGTLKGLAQALNAAGQPDKAAQALAECKQILAAAGLSHLLKGGPSTAT